MARETKTIQLKKPFEGAKGVISAVVVQEPTAGDFFALGAPQTWVRTSGGMALVDNDAAIRAYAERLIVEPDPVLAMNNMSVRDAIAVKDAIVGFFSEPAQPARKFGIASSRAIPTSYSRSRPSARRSRWCGIQSCSSIAWLMPTRPIAPACPSWCVGPGARWRCGSDAGGRV